MSASGTPCDGSSTVSFSGQRVAAIRARRSSRSASGISIVNGRMAVLSAGLSVMTAIGVLLDGDSGEVTARSLRVSSAHRPRREPRVRPRGCSLGCSLVSQRATESLPLGFKAGDVVVVGDRPDAQRIAIGIGVALLVTSNGTTPPDDV